MLGNWAVAYWHNDRGLGRWKVVITPQAKGNKRASSRGDKASSGALLPSTRAAGRSDNGAEAEGSVKVAGSVDNALRLLLLFRDREPVGVSQAATELGVARSTAHRLLAILLSYGFVAQDLASRAYRPGPRLMELGMNVARNTDMLSVIHPFLEQLSVRVDETVHLMVLDGTDCRFVDSVECMRPLRVTARVGVVYPAHATSGGKVLLAELSDLQLRELYRSRTLASRTEQTVTTRDELFKELTRIREQGYAVNHGESTNGISAVAMVQRTSRGNARGAVAISAPDGRLTADCLPEFVNALREVTTEVAGHLH